METHVALLIIGAIFFLVGLILPIIIKNKDDDFAEFQSYSLILQFLGGIFCLSAGIMAIAINLSLQGWFIASVGIIFLVLSFVKIISAFKW